MPPMQHLRYSARLARLVLAWFVLTLGVAIASPIVSPQSMELVCTDGQAMKLVVLDADGQDTTAAHPTLDCPACLAVTLPAPVVVVAFDPPHPLAHALHPHVAARIAALAGAPLPPRGPPSLL